MWLMVAVVAVAATEEVKMFCLDCATQSKFEIANALWDLCDPDTTHDHITGGYRF